MSDLGLRLVHGARSFNLNETGKCHLSRDFVPPATVEAPVIASGVSRSDGRGVVVSKRASVHPLTFTVRLIGDSGGDVQARARSLQSVLQHAGDDADPLYLELRTSTDQPIPLWGQFGAPLLFEVLDGSLNLSDDYAFAARRKRAITAQVNLTLQPAGLGQEQKACAATGGIFEDVYGSSDGRSKGTIIPEATTNKMTNPVFGHSNYTNDWAFGANLDYAKNTDREFTLPNTDVSIMLGGKDTTGNYIYQTINVGNTNAHSLGALVKLPDGGTVSSTQVQLYYNTALTTTYQSLGNGWYWIKAENFSGLNLGIPTGIVVKKGYRVYLAAIQLEEKAYCTTIGWGDMLGWTWSGTAHASTSSRTAASCKVFIDNTVVNSVEGSIRMVVRFDVSNTFGGYMFLCDLRDGTHTSAPCLFFNYSDEKIYLQTNTSTYTATSALTFSAGAIYMLHATWGAGTATLYVNGAQVDSNSYTAVALGANLFIGSDYSSGNKTVGTMSLATYDRALSAAEVLTDYNDALPLVTAGKKIESIPWMWTDDGDNILSLDTGKLPLGIVGGVPGNMAAVTKIRLTTSSNLFTVKGVLLSCFDADCPVKAQYLLTDESGSAAGGDYGGQHKATAAVGSSSPTALANPITPNRVTDKMLNGLEFYVIVRLKAASAASLYLYTSQQISASDKSYSTARLITTNTSYRLFRTNTLILQTYNYAYADLDPVALSVGGVYGKTVSGTLNVDVDWWAIVPRNMVIITTSLTSGSKIVYQGLTAYDGGAGGAPTLGSRLPCTGDTVEMVAERYNMLQAYVGSEESIDPLTTYQITIDDVRLTPRWRLL